MKTWIGSDGKEGASGGTQTGKQDKRERLGEKSLCI